MGAPIDFTQTGNLYRVLDAGQKPQLFGKIAATVQGVPEEIRRRQVALLAKSDPAYRAGAAMALKS